MENRSPGKTKFYLITMRLIGFAVAIVSMFLIETKPIKIEYPEQHGLFALDAAVFFLAMALGRRKWDSWIYVLIAGMFLWPSGSIIFSRAFWHTIAEKAPLLLALIWILTMCGGFMMGYSQRVSARKKALATDDGKDSSLV